MSAALEKNKDALKSVTGDESLSSLIQSCKIGVYSESNSLKSGELIAKSLGDLLGRFWHNLDVTGIYSNFIIESATTSSKSCQFDSSIRQQWIPPYDFVIAIGVSLPSDSVGISIGADGWTITAGKNASLSDDPNPIGPFLASALAAAEAFKTVFNKDLHEEIISIPDNFIWNSWYGNLDDSPSVSDLTFDDVHVFGVGAVSHGLFWILQNWPKKVSGKIHLIDPDDYDVGNAQRYLGMSCDDINKPKTERMVEKLSQIHPELIAIGHKMDMNDYFTKLNPQCIIRLAISGLDSIEGRRQLALKLPKNIVNMWTSELHVGASSFSFENNWPCMYCAYPDTKEKIPDETGLIHKELGLHPPRVRELLDSGNGIDMSDAQTIGKKLAIDPKSIVNKPLRSVRGQMCATKKIILQENSSETTVPFAFASGIAGIIGFIETLREIKHISTKPGKWQMSLLKYPTDYCWTPRSKLSDCYLCSDNVISEIINKKYS